MNFAGNFKKIQNAKCRKEPCEKWGHISGGGGRPVPCNLPDLKKVNKLGMTRARSYLLQQVHVNENVLRDESS